MLVQEEFLHDPNHLIIVSTTVRAVYNQFLTDPENELKSVSVEGTLVGCLTEVQ